MWRFYFCVLAIFAAAYFFYRRWARYVAADLRIGADAEWDRLTRLDPDLLKELSRERFNAIYHRVHFPRFPAYALACATTFVASSPLILGLLGGALWAGEQLGLTPEPVEFADRYLLDGDRVVIFSEAPTDTALYYAEALGGFYYFFGLIGAWLLIVTFFVRRYHKQRPRNLRDEIILARQPAKDQDGIPAHDGARQQS